MRRQLGCAGSAARTLARCSRRRRCHRRQPAARCTPAPNHPVSASPPPNEPLVRSDPAACAARRDSGARREQRRRSATAPAACRKPARTHLRRGDEVVQVHDLQRAGEILRHGWQARCRDQLPRVMVSGRTSGRQARQRPQGQRRHRLRVDSTHRASERRRRTCPCWIYAWPCHMPSAGAAGGATWVRWKKRGAKRERLRAHAGTHTRRPHSAVAQSDGATAPAAPATLARRRRAAQLAAAPRWAPPLPGCRCGFAWRGRRGTCGDQSTASGCRYVSVRALLRRARAAADAALRKSRTSARACADPLVCACACAAGDVRAGLQGAARWQVY